MTERSSIQMKVYMEKPAVYKELVLLLSLLLTVIFPFQLSCASVFVNCSRLNLMFITNLVAVTMNIMSIMHFIQNQEVVISRSLLERSVP